jgi:hypothetical protein
MQPDLELLLFTHDSAYARAAVDGGMDAIVVDWEWRGKSGRQAGRDTEINRGTEDDLARMRDALDERATLICRINNWEEVREHEVERAVALGADEIWLPMVRELATVSAVLRQLAGRARLGVQVETADALDLGAALQALDLARVYIGLNDLHIDLGRDSLFDPLADGTVQRFRDSYGGRFGVAGFTHPALGRPIGCRLLLAEMAQLQCSFAVARRSFRADVPAGGIPDAITAVRACHAQLLAREPVAVLRDHAELQASLQSLRRPSPPTRSTQEVS